jgi:hypothetical protein
MVSEDHTGVRKYTALLFQIVNASVTLDLPTVEPGGVASPEDYPAALQAGFVAYEVRAASGPVQAYLLVPAQARVDGVEPAKWERGARGQRDRSSHHTRDGGKRRQRQHVRRDQTMLRTVGILIAIASLVAGCGQATTVTLSESDKCTQDGGVWRPALGMCERGSAGGGG